MARTSRMVCLAATLIVAFLISGCQSTYSKWSTAWKERTKPKANFQGVDGQEEVTYWPNKPSKTNSKSTDSPSSLKDKLVRNPGQSKREAQLVELMKEGDLLRKNSQYEEARVVYNKALLIAPDNPDVHHRMAIVADKLHQIELADEHYQAALRLRPRDPKLLNDMGYSYYLRGNMKQAEITLKQALSIDNTHKIAMSNLGTIYAQQNRYPEALEMFRRGMSEADAQQSVAMLLNQGQSLAASGQMPNQGHSNAGPIIPTKSEESRDYSKMSQKEIEVKMAQLRQEAIRRRALADQESISSARNLVLEEERKQQQQMTQNNPNPFGNPQGSYVAPGQPNGNAMGAINNQQGFGPSAGAQTMLLGPGTTSQGMNAPYNGSTQTQVVNVPYNGNSQSSVMNVPYSNSGGPPSQAMNGMPFDHSGNPAAADQALAGASGGNQTARIFRGPASGAQSYRPDDRQMQQGWDQRSSPGANNLSQTSGYSNASQMATQLGMSAGPGSMFPVMQSPEPDNRMMGVQNSSRETRVGNEFQRSPENQSNQNGYVNTVEQASNRSATNFGDDQNSQSVAPASPISNWSSPAMGALNWQSDTRSPSDWSSETIPTNGQGSAPNYQRANGFDSQPGMNSNPARSGNEMSRPYSGTWPNSNTLPQRQTQNISINGRSPETLEMMGINPGTDSGGASSYQNGGSGSASGSSTNSLPMYPFAPSR